MPQDEAILAVVTRALLGAVDGRGVDRGALLSQAGLGEHEIDDPDGWVPIAKHARVGQAIKSALPGENLGLQTGTRIYGDPRGALGYALRRSGDHGQALSNFFAYQNVVNRALTVGIVAGVAETSVELRLVPELAAVCHPAEALFAAWVGISRHLTGQAWRPGRVTFTHAAQGDTREHHAFFGCDVRFEQSETTMVIPAAARELAIAPVAHELDAVLPQALELAASFVATAAERRALDQWFADLTSQRIELGATAVDSEPALVARLELARGLLVSSRSFVYEAAYLLGFEQHELEQRFMQRFGVAPRSLRMHG